MSTLNLKLNFEFERNKNLIFFLPETCPTTIIPNVKPTATARFRPVELDSLLSLLCAIAASANETNINVPNNSAKNSLTQSFLIFNMLFSLYLKELNLKKNLLGIVK